MSRVSHDSRPYLLFMTAATVLLRPLAMCGGARCCEGEAIDGAGGIEDDVGTESDGSSTQQGSGVSEVPRASESTRADGD